MIYLVEGTASKMIWKIHPLLSTRRKVLSTTLSSRQQLLKTVPGRLQLQYTTTQAMCNISTWSTTHQLVGCIVTVKTFDSCPQSKAISTLLVWGIVISRNKSLCRGHHLVPLMEVIQFQEDVCSDKHLNTFRSIITITRWTLLAQL